MDGEIGMDSLSDVYHRRRTVQAYEPHEVEVIDVSRHGEDELAIGLNIAEELWYWIVPITTAYTADSGLSPLLQQLDELPLLSLEIEDLVEKRITVEFNEEMDAASLEDSDNEYELRHSNEFEIAQEGSGFEGVERKITNSYLYHQGENYIEGTIGVPEEVENETNTFRLPIHTAASHPLVWELDLPKTTSEEGDSVARLIERLGGGEPGLVADETVYVVSADQDFRGFDELKLVGPDTTGKWVMLTPSDFEDFQEFEPEPESNSASTIQPATPSQRRRAVGAHFALMGMVLIVSRPVVVSFLERTILEMPEGGSEARLEGYLQMVGLMDTLLFYLPVPMVMMGLFLWMTEQ